MAEEAAQLERIRERFVELNEQLLRRGVPLASLMSACKEQEREEESASRSPPGCGRRGSLFLLVSVSLPIICALAVHRLGGLAGLLEAFEGTRCLVPNNYLSWEFTRPLSNCDFCRGVDSPILLGNVTREGFARYAYSSKPIIVKRAASHWLAGKVFSLQFFRSLYDNIDGAYESVDEECQFLHFSSDFANLREVLRMSERRARNLPGERSWYVGWKNCHPQVLEIMRQFYEPPHFLPQDADLPNTNYIFLGYDQGAGMHLDYIPRLMWQGQIIGSKSWRVAPTPECDDVCQPFSFFVDTGDVVLLDTRIWYHGTQVENGKFSLTITSEYG